MGKSGPTSGYLSDDTLGQLAESKDKERMGKPLTKKITEFSCRMVTLIPHQVGAAGTYNPILSRDSRVHGTEIPKTPSTREWIIELTTGMGPRPVHPDERPPLVTRSPQYSDSEDDYEEEEEEPKYLWIHHSNPVSDNAPQHKKDE